MPGDLTGRRTDFLSRLMWWYVDRQNPNTITGARLRRVRFCVSALSTGSIRTPSLTDWTISVARAYLRCSRTDSAISYLEAIISKTVHDFGFADPFVGVARQLLIAAFQQAGRQSDAVVVAQDALAKCRQHLGEKSRTMLQAHLDLLQCQSVGTPDAVAIVEAEAFVNEVERKLAKDDLIILTARMLLAQLYHRYGRGGDALKLALSVIAEMDRTIGPAHPRTQAARAVLASL